MAAILQLRRGTSNVTLTEGELYLHQGSGSVQFGSGSSQHTLVKIGPNAGNVSLDGNLSITGNLTVSQNITFGGSLITLGDANTDNIVISGELSSSLIPNDDDAFDLGSSLKRYKNLYVVSASIDNITLNGSNIVSSSQQISDYNIFLEIGGDSVVSGSSQIDLTQTTNYISGIKTRLNAETVISGSSQIDALGFLQVDGDNVISGSSQVQIDSVTGFTSFSSSVDSRLDELESDSSELFSTASDHESRIGAIEGYSSSLDSRLDYLEGEFSTSVDSRIDLLESFSSSLDSTFVTETELNDATASLSASLTITDVDFENRINTLETTFSSSVDLRLDNSESTGSDHESRITNLTSFTGSYATTGSNLFIGNQTITGSIQSSGSVEFQGIPWPVSSFEKHFLLTQPYSHNGRSYQGAAIGLELTSSYGTVYENSILIHNYDNHLNQNFGTEVNVGSNRAHIMAMASGSNSLANVSVQDVGDETTLTLVYGDTIQIGLFNGENIEIGNDSSLNTLRGSNTTVYSPISSSTYISASSFVGDGSKISDVSHTNIIFGDSNIVSGSSQVQIDSVTGFTSFSSSVDSRLDQTESSISNIHSYTSSLKQAIDVSGSDLIVLGNLTVQGTQTSLNTTQVLIEDLVLTLASGSADGSEANGAGIEIAGANQSITWDNPNTRWSITSEVSASGFIGDGSGLINVTAGDVQFSNILNKPTLVSGSDQVTQSLDSRYLQIEGDNVVSGSSQINISGSSDYIVSIKSRLNSENVHSGSYLGTATTSNLTEGVNLYYTDLKVKTKLDLEGVFSSSAQVNADTITNFDSNVLSYNNSLGVISGSSQVNADTITNFDSNVLDKMNVEGVLSGSDQVTQSLDTRYLQIEGDGVVSGSSQIDVNDTQNFQTFSSSVDGRLDTLEGSFSTSVDSRLDLLENFSSSQYNNDSQSFDSRLDFIEGYSSSLDSRLDSLEIDQHTHSNKANLDEINQNLGTSDSPIFVGLTLSSLSAIPSGSSELNAVFLSSSNELTYRALGTAALYHVTSSDGVALVSGSIAYESDNLLTAGAVKKYVDWRTEEIIDAVGAADITSVHAGDGLGGGGLSGNVTLSLDTSSAHFNDGVISNFTSLNLFTSSQEGQNLTLESVTSSFDVRLTNLESNSSSQDIRLNNIEGFTSSIDTTIKTKLNVEGVISGSIQILGGSGILSSSVSNFTDYSSSVDVRLDNLELTTASFDVRLDSLELDSASQDGRLDNIEVFTSSIDTTIKTKLNFEGVISGSGQLTASYDSRYVNETDFTSFSSSVDGRLDLLETNSSSLENIFEEKASLTHTLVSGSSQIQLIKTDSGSFSTDMVGEGSSNLYYTDTRVKTKLNTEGVISGSDQLTGSLVDLTSDQTISGTKTFTDIVVNGTGSFAYFISTESELNIIGQSFIVLNNDTPTERYAGLAVYDSGSAGVTASLQFDGQLNDWFYEYSDDGGVTTDHGVVLFGPEYSTKGSPTYNTENRILKSNGNHHLLDSNISDTGTLITLGSNSVVSGTFYATGTTLVSGSSQIIYSGISSIPSGIVSGSSQITPLLPTGVVSGSSQIDLTATTNYISGIKTRLNAETVISGSSQVTLSSAIGYGSLLRSDADDTATGIITLSNLTQSTSNTTGALIVSGGVGIAKTLNVGEDVVAYSSSDIRLKDNILPISNPLQKINSIGGYSFDWNEEKQHIYKGKDYGVIAQEIEQILPELVDTRENGYKAVKYDKLVSLLIEGIKELSHEVQELKNKLNQ